MKRRSSFNSILRTLVHFPDTSRCQSELELLCQIQDLEYLTTTQLHLHFRVLDTTLERHVSVSLAGHQDALSSS